MGNSRTRKVDLRSIAVLRLNIARLYRKLKFPEGWKIVRAEKISTADKRVNMFDFYVESKDFPEINTLFDRIPLLNLEYNKAQNLVPDVKLDKIELDGIDIMPFIEAKKVVGI